jgi:hypothetical protein
VALGLALLLSGRELPAETLVLGLRPPPGGSWQRRITLTQELTVEGSPRPLIQRSQVLTTDFRTVAAGPQGAVVEGRVTSLTYRQDDLGGKAAWDSRRPEGGAPAPVRDLAARLGRPFAIRISPAGRITAVEGLGPGAVRSLAEIYPPGPVKPGDTWATTLDLGEAGLSLDGILTLQGRRKGRALIDLAAALGRTPGGGIAGLDPELVGYDLRGVVAGPLEVEEGTGVPVRIRWEYRGEGKLELGGKLNLPLSISAPFVGRGVFTVEPVEG